MKIRTIQVESFKRFRAPFVLDQLADGINLIAAPNGSGKSTLAEAVRVAFLERHRSSTLGELAPWSQPGASPSVQVEFMHGGQRFRVAKTFGSRKSCLLDTEGASLTGEAAETRLSEMFSFSHAAKGASRPEHQGVPGLLWVRQGTAGDIAEPVDSAHDYISRALGDGVGELAATAGDRVIERVEAELGVLHTRGGRPTGDFAKAIDQLAAARLELQSLEQAIADYETTVDRYGRLRAQHAQGEQERPWEQLREQAREAALHLQAIDKLAHEVEQLALQRQLAQAGVAKCTDALAVLEQEDRDVRQRAETLQAAQARDAQTLADVRLAEQALERARLADTQARAQSAAARRVQVRQDHVRALERARARAAALRERADTVQSHQASRAGLLAVQARSRGFAGAGAKLQAAEAALATAQARLDAVSTRIEYDLASDGVALAGEAISGTGARTLSRPTELLIEGVGRLRIVPGARDLAGLEAECDRARQLLAELLQGWGVVSAPDARAREQELVDAQAEIRHLDALIAGLAPKGLDALLREVTEAAGEIANHEQALAALPADDGPTTTVAAAQAHEEATQAALAAAQQAVEHARDDAGRAQEQLRLARRELQAAQERVAAPGREERRQSLAGERGAAQGRVDSLSARLLEQEGRVAAARPAQLRQDIDRWTASATALEATHARCAAELHQLAGQLEAKGALGLQEDAAGVQERVARLQRLVDDRTRRAAALSHLLKVLEDRRAETARRIRAPLQRHLNHYLAIQFPGTEVELDERLRPSRITRAGGGGTETGGFSALSGGEREQLGIIARLAYADLLQEAGKPTLLMLDDSLVNSDRARLAQMKRVLYDAAQRHQILIFTCHEENWMDMGVTPRTLQ